MQESSTTIEEWWGRTVTAVWPVLRGACFAADDRAYETTANLCRSGPRPRRVRCGSPDTPRRLLRGHRSRLRMCKVSVQPFGQPVADVGDLLR